MSSASIFCGTNLKQVQTAAQGLVDFIATSPTPFHVVNNFKKKLKAHNFEELYLTKTWILKKEGLYFYTLNNSCIVAFAIGGKYLPGSGISIIGTHTDSPCLKLKPNYSLTKSGYEMISVQQYGGGIWSSWFDRELAVAGRVFVKNSQGSVTEHLVHIQEPILHIPHLAIHLDRKVNESFSPNLETHLCPVISTSKMSSFLNEGKERLETSPLSYLLAEKIGCPIKDIIDFDLSVVDFQLPLIGGSNKEFIFAPRLDNLLNAYCSFEGFVESLRDFPLESEPNIRMVVGFDNEECGSLSFQGAETHAFSDSLHRIAKSLGSDGLLVENSFMLSADQAHGLHPNYPEKHEGNHQIGLHDGVVLKTNFDQRYATTGFTSAIIKMIAERCNVPVQQFVVRNDIACGTTIGPITSANIGIKAADIGFPMLSMHSIREMCGTVSVLQALTFYKAYFKELPALLKEFVESK